MGGGAARRHTGLLSRKRGKFTLTEWDHTQGVGRMISVLKVRHAHVRSSHMNEGGSAQRGPYSQIMGVAPRSSPTGPRPRPSPNFQPKIAASPKVDPLCEELKWDLLRDICRDVGARTSRTPRPLPFTSIVTFL